MESYEMETSPDPANQFIAMSPMEQPTQIRPHLVLSVMVLLVSTIGMAVYGRVSLKKAILFILALSVISTWANLYYIAAAKKQAKLFNLSSKCFGGDKGWTRATAESLAGLFFQVNDPCEEYFIAIMVDPFWEVSLLEAVTGLMVKSMGALGNMAGAFFTSIIEPLPVFWRLPVLGCVLLILAYLVRDFVRLKIQQTQFFSPVNATIDFQADKGQIEQEVPALIMTTPALTMTTPALTMTTPAETDPPGTEVREHCSTREGKKPVGYVIKKYFKQVFKSGKSKK